MNLSTISLALTRLGWMFSPAALFAAGEQGVWYDPSDLTTLFQDAAGTTAVTNVQQPVGLMLDKSKGLVLGSEATSGAWANAYSTTFDTFTSTGPSSFTAATTGAKGPRTQVNMSVPAAGWYVMQFTATFSGGSFTTSGPAAAGSPYSPAIGVTMPTASGTAFKVYFYATGALGSFVFNWSASGASTLSVTGISVKELPGNHAFQTTSASRPVLSARYNLLTKTEQFDDGVWTKTNTTVTANTTAAPDGTSTADKLVETTATGVHRIQQTVAPAAATHTVSCYAKAGERTSFALTAYDDTAGATRAFAIFDLSNGTVLPSTIGTAAIVAIGNGWYRCSVTTSAALSVGSTFVWVSITQGVTSSYTGDGTSGIYIWGADLRVSNDALGQPAYQRVNTATDYDTVGFKPYLAFDGVDDSLVTNSIDFTATDKMTVFAGVRKLSDATSYAMVAELSAAVSSNNGTFALMAPFTASTYGFALKGTLGADAVTAASFAAPISNVLTVLADISGDLATILVNGVQAAQNTSDRGTGNYGNHPLFIGRRNNASLPFNGRIYSLIVRGAASTTAQITSTEGWVNGKTGAY